MVLAIRTSELGKRYRVHDDEFRMLRDRINWIGRTLFTRYWRSNGSTAALDGFWALRNISLEIERGDVVGLIGKNGAGKSTLLRVLSRVTAPTCGLARIRGRVGSLLEVGAGFHGALTGRENILLSGVIHGLSRREVMRQHDEIVSFAGIKPFLEMPARRYSTGMLVRLAFAVAVHMMPEIVILDEVLSVADAQFQEKCIAKTLELARAGRTILFVSHNLNVVSRVCRRAIWLAQGQVVQDGPCADVITAYLHSSQENTSDSTELITTGKDNNPVRIRSVTVRNASGSECLVFPVREAVTLEITYECLASQPTGRFSVRAESVNGSPLFAIYSPACLRINEKVAVGTMRCHIPLLPLVPGRYGLTVEFISGANHRGNAYIVYLDVQSMEETPGALGEGPLLVEAHWSD